MQSIKAAICIVGIIGFVTGSVAKADDAVGTGNELVKSCNQANADQSNSLWMYCIGYVSGMHEGLNVGFYLALNSAMPNSSDNARDAARDKILSYCIPNGVTREQKGLVVAKYLRDHPEKLNVDEVSLVAYAFEAAWPCDNKN